VSFCSYSSPPVSPLFIFFNVFCSGKQAIQVSLLVGELSKTGKLDDLSYTYWDENFTSKVLSLLSSVHYLVKAGNGVESSTTLSI
jgi:hypothetical protein